MLQVELLLKLVVAAEARQRGSRVGEPLRLLVEEVVPHRVDFGVREGTPAAVVVRDRDRRVVDTGSTGGHMLLMLVVGIGGAAGSGLADNAADLASKRLHFDLEVAHGSEKRRDESDGVSQSKSVTY